MHLLKIKFVCTSPKFTKKWNFKSRSVKSLVVEMIIFENRFVLAKPYAVTPSKVLLGNIGKAIEAYQDVSTYCAVSTFSGPTFNTNKGGKASLLVKTHRSCSQSD